MTAVELRGLLERVEAHGGPIGIDDGDVFVDGHFYVRLSPRIRSLAPIAEHHLVGVLKRDLIERGCEYEIVYADEIPGKHACRVFTPSGDSWTLYMGHSDDSELEAVLKAYLAVAEAEGWGA